MSYYCYSDWESSGYNSYNGYAWCEWCERHGHILTECPNFIAARRAQQSYQVEGHEIQGWGSQTYEQGWTSHPNYSWSDQNSYGGGQAQYPAPPPPQQP